jgi:hypothetical protein
VNEGVAEGVEVVLVLAGLEEVGAEGGVVEGVFRGALLAFGGAGAGGFGGVLAVGGEAAGGDGERHGASLLLSGGRVVWRSGARPPGARDRRVRRAPCVTMLTYTELF